MAKREQTTANLLASQPEDNGRVMPTCSLVPRPDTPLLGCPTNLDLTTPRGKALAVAAGSPSDLEFDESGQCEMDAVAYLLYPEEIVSRETGELTVGCRTVLFDRHGRTWRTTSQSAPHALHRILQLYTSDEWAAGLPLVISERRSRKTGRTYHDMRVRLSAGDPAS